MRAPLCRCGKVLNKLPYTHSQSIIRVPGHPSASPGSIAFHGIIECRLQGTQAVGSLMRPTYYHAGTGCLDRQESE
jgi:hypothetical protein